MRTDCICLHLVERRGLSGTCPGFLLARGHGSHLQEPPWGITVNNKIASFIAARKILRKTANKKLSTVSREGKEFITELLCSRIT
jgi:hypothetical protein